MTIRIRTILSALALGVAAASAQPLQLDMPLEATKFGPYGLVGPSFGALEVPGVIEAVLDTFRQQREGRETFIDCFKRIGMDAFKSAANAARLADKHEDLHALPKTSGYAKDAQEA